MTSKRLGELIDRLFEDCQRVLVSKGHDYTQASEDRLHNFKSIAQLIPIRCPCCSHEFKLPPRVVWLVYFLKHVWSIITWAGLGKQESGESLHGRFVDITNYSGLGEAISVEEADAAPETAEEISGCDIPF